MSKAFTEKTLRGLKALIADKSKEEAIDHLTTGLRNQSVHSPADIRELLKDEEFLNICKFELGFNVKGAVA